MNKYNISLFNKTWNYQKVRVYYSISSGNTSIYLEYLYRDKMREYEQQKFEKCKQILKDLKTNGCTICGYNLCQKKLDFHHVNPEDKKFKLANLYKYSNTRIAEELMKCILLCKSCHCSIEPRRKSL